MNKNILFIVLSTLLVYGASVFSEEILWDSLCIKNAVEGQHPELVTEMFRQAAQPFLGMIHALMLKLPHYLFFYKLIVWFSILGAAIVIYKILVKLDLFSPASSAMTAVITMIWPVYSIRFELIMMPAALCYFSFFVGVLSFQKFIEYREKRKWYYVSIPFFLLSYLIDSLIVFHYGVLFGFFLFYYVRSGVSVKKNLLDFIRENILLLVLPALYFITVSLVFKKYGEYSAYNILQPGNFFRPDHLLNNAFVGVKALIFDQLLVFKYMLTSEAGTFNYLIPVSFALAFAIPFFMNFKSDPGARTRIILLLFFIALLFMFAIYPYAMIGYIQVAKGYKTRFALLASLPIALGIVALINHFLKKAWMQYFCFAAVLFFCISLNLRNQLLWQNRYIKYLAIIEVLKKDPGVIKGNTVLLEDNTGIGMKVGYTIYDINWILKQVYGDESHFGMAFYEKRRYHEYMGNVAKYEYFSRFNIMKEYVENDSISTLKIYRSFDIPETRILLDFIGSSGSEKKNFLSGLVRIEVINQPIKELIQ